MMIVMKTMTYEDDDEDEPAPEVCAEDIAAMQKYMLPSMHIAANIWA